jgi:hypothetical protein
MSNPLDTGSSFQHEFDVLALAPDVDPPLRIGQVGSWGDAAQADFSAEDFPTLDADHARLVAPLRRRSDAELERIFKNFLNLMMTGAHGESMVDRFMAGSGQEYLHDVGSYLSEATYRSGAFAAAALTAKRRVEASLGTLAGGPASGAGGELVLFDWRRLRIRAPKLNFEFSQAAAVFRILTGSPSPDLVLKCLIGGTHGTRVSVTRFGFNPGTRDYAARLRFEIFDNFGVDETDLYTVPAPWGDALIAFWVLQHERYGHRPFVNRIVVNETIRGSY